MNRKFKAPISSRTAIIGLIASLACAAFVVDSFNVAAWKFGHADSAHNRLQPVSSSTATITSDPHVTPATSQHEMALANLPSAKQLLAEAERILQLFDDGRMHEVYALFNDAAKAQVPEAVFVKQAQEVLDQLGPRKPDGWNDANWISTLLNGRSRGRKFLLWKLHRDTMMFDVGSWRVGTLSDSDENLVLDVSTRPIRLAMFSEYKLGQNPGASVWLPRTCSHPGEDPLQHCKKPDVPSPAN